MAVCCSPDKHYGVYFTEVQDIEDHCVDDLQEDESAGADGQLCHLSLVTTLGLSSALATGSV